MKAFKGVLVLTAAVLVVWGVALLEGRAWALIAAGIACATLAAITQPGASSGRET